MSMKTNANLPLFCVSDCAQLANLMPREQYRVFTEIWDIVASAKSECKDIALNGGMPYYYNDNLDFLGNETTLHEMAESIAKGALLRYEEAEKAEARKAERSAINTRNIKARWHNEKQGEAQAKEIV